MTDVELTPRRPYQVTGGRQVTPLALRKAVDSMGIIPVSHSELTEPVGLFPQPPNELVKPMGAMGTVRVSPQLLHQVTESVEAPPRLQQQVMQLNTTPGPSNRVKGNVTITPEALLQVMDCMGMI